MITTSAFDAADYCRDEPSPPTISTPTMFNVTPITRYRQAAINHHAGLYRFMTAAAYQTVCAKMPSSSPQRRLPPPENAFDFASHESLAS